MELAKDQSEALLRRCQIGDEEALEELIRRWERRLFYYIRRLVPYEEDAWDVLQQTWMRAVKGISDLREPDKFVPWLYRIARNTAFSHQRSLLAREKWIDRAAAVDELSGVETLEAEWTVEEVHLGMEKLSAHHRDVITLFFLDDLSMAEIAEVLGIADGTVKSRLFYGKKALREVLARKKKP